jgi:hypothetical protein
MKPVFVVLIPVLDDWQSLSMLMRDLIQLYRSEEFLLEIIAVDDGSVQPCDANALPILEEDCCIESISVIRLALNLGHQRAIAVGLASLAARNDIEGVIIMDSDGEDRPGDLGRLVSEHLAHPDHIVVARRAERSEAVVFKMGYLAYKTLFRVFVGRNISFGNFSFVPAAQLRRLAHMPEVWNNLPAAIIRSRIPSVAIETKRGTRYAGKSKMNLPSLVMHGLSAMSVYTDVIFTRMLLVAAGISIASFLGMIVVVTVKFATSLAIPGWATTVIGDLMIILTQAVVLVVATTLMLLANRSSRQLIPIFDATAFISTTETLARKRSELVSQVAS